MPGSGLCKQRSEKMKTKVITRVSCAVTVLLIALLLIPLSVGYKSYADSPKGTEPPFILGNMNYYGSNPETVRMYQLEDGTYQKPEREYWTFLGWAETTAGAVIPENQLVPGNTYYARWMKDAYYFYVQGVQVTKNNYGDILGNGTVSFDPLTCTLTLNNATINVSYIESWSEAGAIDIDDDLEGLNVVLKGPNKIVQTTDFDCSSIYGFVDWCSGGLNISGDGTLDITMATTGSNSSYYGMYLDYDTTISGVKIKSTVGPGVSSYIRGVYCDDDLILKNGASLIADTTGSRTDESDIAAVYVDENLYVDSTSYLECTSTRFALNPDWIVEDTIALGALVNTEPTAAGAKPWDKSTGIYTYKYVRIPQVHNHTWDAGKVTKPATTTSDGVKTYTCKLCDETKTEAIPKTGGSDGTAFGPGASAQAAEAAILALTNDKDPKGTVFGVLQLKASKTTKNSIKLTWKKAKGAKKYIIYSNACGNGKKYQKLQTTTKTSVTIKKVAGKKLAKGKYYKFLMVAVDASGKVVSTSKTVHAATAGSKVGNPTKITTKAKKNKVMVKVKKTFKLAAKQAGKKIKKHRAVSYESSNPAVATVTAKGVIKGVKKGKCKVYAYAQNGVCAVIKVTVK